jgi:hypothetical protein
MDFEDEEKFERHEELVAYLIRCSAAMDAALRVLCLLPQHSVCVNKLKVSLDYAKLVLTAVFHPFSYHTSFRSRHLDTA